MSTTPRSGSKMSSSMVSLLFFTHLFCLFPRSWSSALVLVFQVCNRATHRLPSTLLSISRERDDLSSTAVVGSSGRNMLRFARSADSLCRISTWHWPCPTLINGDCSYISSPTYRCTFANNGCFSGGQLEPRYGLRPILCSLAAIFPQAGPLSLDALWPISIYPFFTCLGRKGPF